MRTVKSVARGLILAVSVTGGTVQYGVEQHGRPAEDVLYRTRWRSESVSKEGRGGVVKIETKKLPAAGDVANHERCTVSSASCGAGL